MSKPNQSKSAEANRKAMAKACAEGIRRLRRRRFHAVGAPIGIKTAVDTPFGLSQAKSSKRRRKSLKIVRHKGPVHRTIIAGTGQGKGISVLIPTLQLHDGQVIAIDPKGELTDVVAQRRRDMGDQVVIIDMFGKLGFKTDSLNPIDVIRLLSENDPSAVEDLAEMVAAELGAGHEISRDPFWWNTSTALLAGLIAYAATNEDPTKQNLGTVVKLLSADDAVYALASLLDAEGKKMNQFAHERIAEFLATPDGNNGSTRGCVLTQAQQMIHCLQAQRIARSLHKTTFDLRDLLDGEKPLSILIVFPPEKSRSHRGLLRLHLASLTQVLWSRKQMPTRNTLICLDEAANIGKLDFLPEIHSFGRGSGVQCLTAWQSLGQLADVYPTQWRTIIENSLIQTFGLHATAVDPMATLLGVSPSLIRSLRSDEQITVVPSGSPQVLGKIDYRTHPILSALADENPRYARMKDKSAPQS